ncbi:sulfur carrier protein ThiS [Rheinheimera baltica]|uniref:Sulfur carrier protein ThiS n=1 Tax=Rheinheimera baltica TaxID=67576 RepID=A0ABT9I5P0_9GAMM|nr:sulfur carrier protein ThiS [Rheinheimera baltica]MDP5138330.1 sulfur carrier protein ThiS [Rheinheimera baltica]MDP5148877.1 sulfur carrier protein ThiS [Rheinheimera baltica]
MTKLTIWLNGQAETLTYNQLTALLTRFNAPFAVALNGHFVAAASYEHILLQAGDQLDIVSPIAGG